MNHNSAVRKFLASITLFLVLPLTLFAQSDSVKNDFRITGFIDVYYAYDFNKPEDHIRQPFLYNHNRHNEFNINLAMVHAAYVKKGVRANLGMMAGTYAQDNYAAEENLLKSIFEANVGVALNAKQTLWLDAGIFPSHIGFESAISTENPTLTRSLLAENSPYFLSGLKLGWDITKSWSFTGVLANGWQRIARPVGNQVPAIGTQLHYHPHPGLAINWSTFAGSDAHDSLEQVRLFNNLYLELEPAQRFKFIAGFDIGAQKYGNPVRAEGQTEDWELWYTPIIIARVALTDKLYLAGRGEYYADEGGVIISYGAPAAFRTYGFSLNLDYAILENAMFRIEARSFRSRDRIFPVDGGYKNSDTFITGSLAVSFP